MVLLLTLQTVAIVDLLQASQSTHADASSCANVNLENFVTKIANIIVSLVKNIEHVVDKLGLDVQRNMMSSVQNHM